MSKLDEMKVELAGTVSEGTYARYYVKNYELNGSPKGYDLEKMVSDPQENVADIIALAKYYYHKNGLIMRVINIIRDFGVGSPTVNYPTKNAKVRRVITEFNNRIDIDSVLKDMMFELSLTGNCAGYNRDGERIDINPITSVEVSPVIVNNKPILVYKNEMSLGEMSDTPEELDKYLDISYPK